MIDHPTSEALTDGQLSPVPRDARLQLGGERLLRLALAAVQEVGEEQLPKTLAGFPNPRMLLTLAAYAYAAGIFDSEEIVFLISDEPQLRYLTAGQAVNENDILRFRRRNGPILLAVLRHVLANVSAETSAGRVSGNSGKAESMLTAEERIHLAVLSDSLRLDD
jgi:hypothetical protein